jgi:hypothetical protein
MNSGRLNIRAFFYVSEAKTDAFPITPTSSMFAEVRHNSQAQLLQAGAIDSLGSIRLVVRECSQSVAYVPERTRVKVKGKTYQMQSNIPLDLYYREMVCAEVV